MVTQKSNMYLYKVKMMNYLWKVGQKSLKTDWLFYMYKAVVIATRKIFFSC